MDDYLTANIAFQDLACVLDVSQTCATASTQFERIHTGHTYLGTLRQRNRAPVVETVWCSSHAVRFNLREVASSAPQRMPFALIIYGLSRVQIGVPERYDCALAAPS